MNIEKHLIEICPFRLGQSVRIKPDPFGGWQNDWTGYTMVIVGMRWEYQRGEGKINIELASDSEIERGFGATDGFSVDDLEPVVV